ncbi:MAG: 50S ribosomal protein L3 [Candidatus Paceibacterota bacterium]
MKFIVGKKLKMGQIWKDNKVIPVTIVEAGPCTVTQVKEKEKDGYNGVQVGFGKIEKESKITKSLKAKPFDHLKECSIEAQVKVGDILDVSQFAEGDIIKVAGVSKGKGNQGPAKRYGFRGAASATHGNKHNHRTTGSIGSRWPQRVVPGKKMAGRMGGIRTTVSGLIVVKIDKEQNLIAIKGAVPGHAGTLLEITAK